METITKPRLSASQAIALSFAGLIAGGVCLLKLPPASQQTVSWLDALFTATSATCVTGLTVVSTSTSWTLFGQVVILLLIQIGGISLITLTSFMLTLFHRQLNLRQRLLVQSLFNQNKFGDMGQLVKQVLQYTLGIELIGTGLLWLQLQARFTSLKALWYALFHAVSAFCNAGFDLFGANSFTQYAGDAPLNLTLMALISFGGLGFPVLHELASLKISAGPFNKRLRRLSLHTKLTLTAALGLFVISFGLIALLEWQNPQTLGRFSTGGKLLASAFEAVTLRTAGFFTIDQAALTPLTQGMACILMLIGAAPASTGGGVKTISVMVLLITVTAALRGQSQLTAFGRRLPLLALQKALASVLVMLLVNAAALIVLHFSESQVSTMALLFEVSSASGTVGLSTGITANLSALGKLVITCCMFIGRLTPLALAMLLTAKQGQAQPGQFPEESIISG